MTKTSKWVIISFCGFFGLGMFACVLTAVLSGMKSARNEEQVFTKQVISHKCTNCGQIIAAETTGVWVKRKDLQGGSHAAATKDTLCVSCVLKLAPLAERLIREGQRAYYAKDYDLATVKFDSSASLGSAKAEPWLDKVAARLNEIENAKFEKDQAEERKTYALLLRAHFLDAGEDIEVHVRGKGNKELRLKYVLFTSVWIWNFQKGELIEEIRAKGFKTVHFSDGYYYSWDLKL